MRAKPGSIASKLLLPLPEGLGRDIREAAEGAETSVVEWIREAIRERLEREARARARNSAKGAVAEFVKTLEGLPAKEAAERIAEFASATVRRGGK